MKEKVVLAYSGGLDTTAIIPWLKETFDYDVICCCIDCGQGNELDGLEERARLSGASKLYIEDLVDDFCDNYIVPCVQANAVYENKYLLGTSMACLRQCLTSRSASANAFFWRIARASSGRSRAFSMSSSAEAEKTASAEPNTSSRWTAPFGPIPGVRVRAMSGISRFIFRIRQSPNEFGSASFGRNRRFRTRFGASVSGCKDRFLPIKMQSCPEVLQKREIFVYLQTRSRESGSDGRVARQRSAKPCTAVRIRFRPH